MKVPSKAEIERARQWREALGLSVDQLADLTGWCRASIFRFEAGVSFTAGGKQRIGARAWHRWKLACSGLNALRQHRLGFDWT